MAKGVWCLLLGDGVPTFNQLVRKGRKRPKFGTVSLGHNELSRRCHGARNTCADPKAKAYARRQGVSLSRLIEEGPRTARLRTHVRGCELRS